MPSGVKQKLLEKEKVHFFKEDFGQAGNLKLRNESCNILKAVNDENLGGHFSLEYKRGYHGALSH
jgi:hypothetical protein